MSNKISTLGTSYGLTKPYKFSNFGLGSSNVTTSTIFSSGPPYYYSRYQYFNNTDAKNTGLTNVQSLLYFNNGTYNRLIACRVRTSGPGISQAFSYSNNNGLTWTLCNSHTPYSSNVGFYRLIKSGNIIYALADTVYKSIDGGTNWTSSVSITGGCYNGIYDTTSGITTL